MAHDTSEKIRAGRAARANEMPAGQARVKAFPSKLRATLVTRENKTFYEVTGYATIFDKAYEMWDMFGSYDETMDGSALDKSLAGNPDVAFLTNHRGITMARTVNGTLDLSKDLLGLHIHGLLNADRQDIRDLASAINDELIDEMSFAFMLNAGEWNDDYTAFRILEADINRGDVSAVNFGANPYTSINARSAEWFELAARMPAPVARAAYLRLAQREDIELDGIADWPVIDETGDDDETPAGETPEAEVKGMSTELLAKRLQALAA